MKLYLFKFLSYSALKYFAIIGSMAAFMLASILVEQLNSSPDKIFLCVISFTLGIYSGDPNSLIFFQRKFRSTSLNDKGYWTPRFFLTIIICIVCIVYVNKLDKYYFIVGALFAYLLPQGRVSNANEFQVIIFIGGVLKTIISILIINNSKSQYSDLPILICLATSSNYLASIIYHLKYIKKDFSNSKLIIKIELIDDFKECCKSFIITLPIHFYTSLGGFAYISLKGEAGIATYFLYDRIIRGLGATVTVFQSKTMAIISKTAFNVENFKSNDLIRYIYLYLVSGFIIGIVFILFGNFFAKIISLDMNIFNNAYLELIPFAVSFMYISNLIGIQIFMVNNNFIVMFVASIIAIISFYSTLLLSDNILLMICIPEISITIFLVYCLYLKSRFLN